MKFQLKPEQFYTFGKWTFFSIAISSIISLIDTFSTLSGSDIVIKAVYIGFYFALVASFNYLQAQLKKPVATDAEMEEMMKMLSKPQEDKNAETNRREKTGTGNKA